METGANSDPNWNLLVEMEGSGLIQNSARPTDWMDVNNWKRNKSQDKPQVSDLDNWVGSDICPYRPRDSVILVCSLSTACWTLWDQQLFSHHAVCWHQCMYLSSQRHMVWGQLPLNLQYWLCLYLWKGGWVVTPKSWPPGDLDNLYSFFAWRTGRARFGDISSIKEHGTTE